MTDNFVRIAYATDMGLFGPTVLSLLSCINSTPRLGYIDLLSVNLTGAAIDTLQKIGTERKVSINIHHIDDTIFDAAPSQVKHISKTTLARLMLPKLVEHRVIYIDGDTLVRRDLAGLYDIDLEGNLLGGVRDFGCLEGMVRVFQGKFWKYQEEKTAIMTPFTAENYINAGVIVMDCARIRDNTIIHDQLQNFDMASNYRSLDQDHINKVFRGKIKYVNPAWNSSWGRTRLQRNWAKRLGATGSELDKEKTGIYHFHGPVKPWNPVPISKLRRNPYAVWSYKLEKIIFDRRYPNAFK